MNGIFYMCYNVLKWRYAPIEDREAQIVYVCVCLPIIFLKLKGTPKNET